MPRTPDFDALYAADPDPFDVGGSWYEQRKIAVTLASLTRARYGLAWDAAAGSGHLARALAGRCGRVVASDASRVAVDALRAGTGAGDAAVEAVHSALPAVPPQAGGADLVVVSEVLYYLDDAQRRATLGMLARLPAELVCVQWRHLPHDAHLSGADALREFEDHLTDAGFRRAVTHEEEDFVLAVLLPPTGHPAAPTRSAP